MKWQVMIIVVAITSGVSSEVKAVDALNSTIWRGSKNVADDKTIFMEDVSPSEPGGKETTLSAAPSFMLKSGNVAGTFAGSADFQGVTRLGNNGSVQVRVSLKGDPATGTAKDIAQAIRVDAGTASFNFAGTYGTFLGKNGIFAWEIRPAVQASYQKATSAEIASSSTSSSAPKEFGIFDSEVAFNFCGE